MLIDGTNSRIHMPPGTFLQPAYIAWSIIKVYCQESKQWVLQRQRTVIPLSSAKDINEFRWPYASLTTHSKGLITFPVYTLVSIKRTFLGNFL